MAKKNKAFRGQKKPNKSRYSCNCFHCVGHDKEDLQKMREKVIDNEITMEYKKYPETFDKVFKPRSEGFTTVGEMYGNKFEEKFPEDSTEIFGNKEHLNHKPKGVKMIKLSRTRDEVLFESGDVYGFLITDEGVKWRFLYQVIFENDLKDKEE